MYSSASASSKELGTVNGGTYVSLIESKNGWSKIKLSGQTRYVKSDHVSKTTKTMYIGNAFDTLYKSARSTNEKVTTVGYGTDVQLQAVDGSWALVKANGREGYIHFSGLLSKNPNTLDEVMYAKEDDLPVYSLATSESSVLKTLKRNAKVTCVAKFGSSWCRVKIDGKYGYIRAGKLAAEKSDTASVSSASKSASTHSSSVSKTMYVGTAYCTVYSSARSTSEKVTVVGYGVEVQVKAADGSWLFVRANGKEGYVRDSSLVAKNPNTLNKTMYAEEDDLPVYQLATSESSTLKTIKRNTKVTCVAEYGNSWYRVKINGAYGYIRASKLSVEKSDAPSTSAASVSSSAHSSTVSKTMYVGNAYNTVYSSARSTGEKVTVVGYGTEVTVKSVEGSWAFVKGSGKEGYVRYSALISKNPNTLSETMYAKEDDLPVYQLATSASTVLKNIDQNTRVTCVAKFDGTWYRVKVDGKYGYIRANKLDDSKQKADASASNSNSNSAVKPSGKVIEADWFNSDIQSVFSRGTTATVTDVRTGIKWEVYRSGGYNHADVQPRTASDTAAMKRATGSDFGTWNRRPIWVTIGSRTYAASMNCMPHGDGSITNNNFDGHYCIHFTRSRTHGTNRICATHQSAIKEALRAAK